MHLSSNLQQKLVAERKEAAEKLKGQLANQPVQRISQEEYVKRQRNALQIFNEINIAHYCHPCMKAYKCREASDKVTTNMGVMYLCSWHMRNMATTAKIISVTPAKENPRINWAHWGNKVRRV